MPKSVFEPFYHRLMFINCYILEPTSTLQKHIQLIILQIIDAVQQNYVNS